MEENRMARERALIWNRQCAGGFVVVFLIVMCVNTEASPPEVSETGAMRYLSQFGYLPPVNPTSGGIISEEAMSRAISEFQSFAGINITGM